jgi:CHRD domain-containing protein
MKRGRRAWLAATVVGLAMLSSQSSLAAGDHDRDRARSLKAFLHGFEEPPAISTTGRGEFEAKVSRDELSFDYKLSFEDLEGVVTQSHIHIGQLSVNGGIAIWLCQTTTNPAPAASGAVPVCPAGPQGGTVEGTVTPAQVIGPAAQGVSPGEFAEVLHAMRSGAAYANVHSSRNPGGEIRGQIQKHDRGGDDRDDHDR